MLDLACYLGDQFVSVQIGEVSFDDHMPSLVLIGIALIGKGDFEAAALEVEIAVSGAGPNAT